MVSDNDDDKDATPSVICPACETRFRYLPEQLDAAGGLLRCGVCQEVFNAKEQLGLIDDSPLPNPADEPDDSPSPRQGAELLEGLSTDDHGFEHHQTPPPRRWPWAILSLLAALLLIAQLAYWQRDPLLVHPKLPASWKVQALSLCATLELRCRRDDNQRPQASEAFISQKLMVRAHPDVSNALRVDAILVNRSPEKRAFPLLELRFSDMYGSEVARRLFTPAEYLAGELNALSQLPSQQPVHIALDIVDPGSAAVNYQIALFDPI